MYKPKIYTETDTIKILDFIEKYPFALITCSNKNGRSVATQVPLMLTKDKKSLQGHVMKHTDHYMAFLQNPNILAVFTGPNAYISSSWYSKPNVASTWNYTSVHVQGTLEFLTAHNFIELMKAFTLKFEGGNEKSPTYYSNIPEEYRKKHMKAIAGFEIKIESIEATFKLSQDKDDGSFENIIHQLENKSLLEQLLATEMKSNRS